MQVTDIQELQKQIKTTRNQVVKHPIYRHMENIEQVRTFMEHHVFAVWDFMSLLKALQKELTCVEVPWLPKANPTAAYLINEIVVEEEADKSETGERFSHYELYKRAMKSCGANTQPIETFEGLIRQGFPVREALREAQAPAPAAAFTNFTFDVIESGKTHVIAAVFTFGREDLISDMFQALIADLHQEFTKELAPLKYYLDRHIEIDGEEHGALALEMTAHLCDGMPEKLTEAGEAAKLCLQKRAALWTGTLESLQTPSTMNPS
jgi:pyrroloquinoline quinone (PQQ) biosynthesis protein C